MKFFWLLLVILILSWTSTAFLLRYAVANKVVDIPNERSSHSIPTPRGGGIAIVITFALALPLLSLMNLINLNELCGLFGAGILVAAIGFVDDHGHIAARWRLFWHFIAAFWALYWLDGLAPLKFFDVSIDLGWLGTFLATVYLVWMLNLYNFMDGIDGLASVEAITVCFGLCLVYWCCGYVDLIWAPITLAVAVMGFLCWNYPPAKIFMGDAGSGFLGISLAVLTLNSAWRAPELLWSGVILLGVFIVDSTWTLCCRLLRGEKLHIAHNTHAYQHAARYYLSHKIVTFTVAAINVFWLLPISLLVGLSVIDAMIGVFVGYIPICFLVWKFKGGRHR